MGRGIGVIRGVLSYHLRVSNMLLRNIRLLKIMQGLKTTTSGPYVNMNEHSVVCLSSRIVVTAACARYLLSRWVSFFLSLFSFETINKYVACVLPLVSACKQCVIAHSPSQIKGGWNVFFFSFLVHSLALSFYTPILA